MLGVLGNRFNALVWGPKLEDLRRPHRWGLIGIRMIQVLLRDIGQGDIPMRAMSLVYTSLLSLVPTLALAFSLLKAFGVDNALRPMLQRFLSPLGAQAGIVIDKIVLFVQNVQVGVLGVLGVLVLLYSVIALIQKVEEGCNHIWRVRRTRPLSRRFTEYLSVLIVGPIVILAAVSITASLRSNAVVAYLSTVEPFGMALYLAGRLAPYVLYSAAFTFLFAFVPNTRVRMLPALGGGIFAGVLWQAASLGFALFAQNAHNYNAIYSSFAIPILLLIWSYVSWLIVFVGCRVAFLLQYPEQISRGPYPPMLGAKHREELGLLVMSMVGYNFMQGRPPWQAASLAHYLRVAPDHFYDIADQLIAAHMLIDSSDSMFRLIPQRDIESLTINDVFEAVRRGAPAAAPRLYEDSPTRYVTAWIERSETARHNALAGVSLRALVIAMLEDRNDNALSRSNPRRPPSCASACDKECS